MSSPPTVPPCAPESAGRPMRLVSGVRGHVAVQQSGQVGLGKQGESALLREAVYTALITGPGTDQH